MQKMYGFIKGPAYYKEYHSGTRQETLNLCRSNLGAYFATDPLTGTRARARVTAVPARGTDPFNGDYLLTATKESRNVSVIGTDRRDGPDIVVTRVTVDGANQTPYDKAALHELFARSDTAGGQAAIRLLTLSPEGQRLLQAADAYGWIIHAIADTFPEIDVAHQSQRSASEVCAAHGRHAIIVSTPVKPATNILSPHDFPILQVVDYVQGIIAGITDTGIFDVKKTDTNCVFENGLLHTENSYLPRALPALLDSTNPETWQENVESHSGNPVVGGDPLEETFDKLLCDFEEEVPKDKQGLEFVPNSSDSDFDEEDGDLCDTDTSADGWSSAGATAADSLADKPTAEDTGPAGRLIRLTSGLALYRHTSAPPPQEELPGPEAPAPKRDCPDLTAQVARKRTSYRSAAPPSPTSTAGAASALWEEQRQDLSVGPKPPAVKAEPPSPLSTTAVLAECLPACPPPPPPSGPPPLAASLEQGIKGNHRSCQITKVPGSETVVVVHSEKIRIGTWENTLFCKELGIKVIFATQSPYRIRQRDCSTTKSQTKLYRDSAHLISHFQHQAAESIAATVQIAAPTKEGKQDSDAGLLTAGDNIDSYAAKDKFQCQLAHAAICSIFASLKGSKSIIDRHNDFA
jgi:hypothetical protein